MVSPWLITFITHSVQITCLLVSLLVTCNQLVKVLTTTLPTKPASLTITQDIFVPSILWRKEVQCMLITQTRVSYSCSTSMAFQFVLKCFFFISFVIFYSHFLIVNNYFLCYYWLSVWHNRYSLQNKWLLRLYGFSVVIQYLVLWFQFLWATYEKLSNALFII